MTATNDAIIKSNRRGRLRDTPEQRDALVNACQCSGLSAPRFAAIHGVKYQTLASWIQVLDNRFVCHLPYDRQAEIFARLGINPYAWRLGQRLP